MKERWTGEVVGTMHMHSITVGELAKRMGISRQRLSVILNCKDKPKDAEFRVWKALLELVEERTKEN